jgi:hypothetical protein
MWIAGVYCDGRASSVVNRQSPMSPEVTTSRHKIPTGGRPDVYSPDVRLWMRSVTCS